jgi:hypothetical protein
MTPGVHGFPADWDDWVAAAGPAGSFLQTSRWARIDQAVNKSRPIVVDLFENGVRCAGALFRWQVPSANTLSTLVRTTLAGLSKGSLECLAGPVLGNADQRGQLDRLLQRIAERAHNFGIRRVRFSGRPPSAAWPDELDQVFAAHGYRCEPWFTALVDIARDDDALLASFRQAARKGIRRCQELGIVVRECANVGEYLRDFSRPLFATRAALNMHVEHDRPERDWWALDEGRHYRYFVAKNPDGAVLGMLGSFRWNGVATEIMSERTLIARKMHLPVQDLLHWEAFRIHRGLGDKNFDLAGFSPHPRDGKEKGIRHFKEKWQGRVVPTPSYERYEPNAAARLVRALRGTQR